MIAGTAFTTRLFPAVVAHWPVAGVNVYENVPAMAVVTPGDHPPGIPLSDVVGRFATGVPLQTAGIGLKVGTVFAFTVTLSDAVVAHRPASGVKVYVVVPGVAVLTADDHVPVMALEDVSGKEGAADPSHTEGMAANVGVTGAVTVTTAVVCPIQPLVTPSIV